LRFINVLISSTILLALQGCVCIPHDAVTASISPDELTQHVTFLTQPALKGRATGSCQSAHVRKYLAERLEQYGCVPWGANPSFELPFKPGKNMIAVLPGSDPELSNEIVLVSAHYDHLKPKWFSYYPGACDNAASVAALLEIAEKISLLPERPKRPICFAFFDAEEMGCLGAFAFTCRDDYIDSQIAAVVNIDLLGRDLLDAVDNCLIVTGTERYPSLQKHVINSCSDHNLKGVPLRADLIDPVGDHVAFASSTRPVLFFTCGINKDYHQTTDTIDRLNFDKLTREAAAIESTVLALANDQTDLLTRSDQPVMRQKDDSLFYILDKFKQKQDMFNLDPNQVRTLDEIITKAKDIDPARISPDELLDLERQSLKKLLGLLKNYSKPLYGFGTAFVEMSELYALDPQTFSDAFRRVIGHYQHNGIPLFKQHTYSDRFMLPITHRNWGLNQLDDGRFVFAFIDTELTLEVRPSVLTGIDLDYFVEGTITACRGDLDRIIDLVFFNRLGDPNTFDREFYRAAGGSSEIPPPEPTDGLDLVRRKMQMAAALRREIEQRFPDYADHPSMAVLSDPNTFMPDPNGRIASAVFLVHTQKEQKRQDRAMKEKELIASLNNPSVSVETRIMYMQYLADYKTRAALSALADITDDQTLFAAQDYVMADAAFPLRYHFFTKQFRRLHEENQDKYKDKTLGQIALEHLKNVTKQNFAADKPTWHKWIERHYK